MIVSDDIQFECVLRRESDARLVFEWRNDPDTLRWSFHTAPKVWERFRDEFFTDYFCFAELPPLFAHVGGERVAFARMQPCADPLCSNKKSCEVSIMVAPKQRGKGVATATLIALSVFLEQQGFEQAVAKIKKGNIPSIRAFERAGYVLQGTVIEEVFDTGESVEVFRYLLRIPQNRPLPQPVYIIAEAGSNWVVGEKSEENRSMAKALIEQAAKAGANAVKFQVFRADTIYAPGAGSAAYLKKEGADQDMHSLFSRLEMPDDLLKELFHLAAALNIDFMASVFSARDFSVVDPLVKRHKVASYEIGHVHLLELIAQTKKPLYLSTGAATPDEIDWAIHFLKHKGSGPITLMHCVAAYPAPPQDMNLTAIRWMQSRFQLPVGLSDHTEDPLIAAVGAVTLGATVIEKHITLDKAFKGPDHHFALSIPEFTYLVDAVRAAEAMRGMGIKTIMPSELELRAFACRGIQALRSIRKGEPFVQGANIAALRPGNHTKGIHPLYLSILEGCIAERNIGQGEGIQRGDWR